MRWLALLLVLAAIPGASAATLSLQLPARVQLSEATVLAGHVGLDGGPWQDPTAVGITGLSLGAANLTVCPIRVPAGGTLVQTLAALRDDCTGGRTHRAPTLRFAPGSDLRFAGDHLLAAMPQASVAALFGDANGTLLLLPSADGARLFAPPEGLRFGATSGRTSVEVASAGERVWYNGTAYAFLSSAPEARIAGRGIATTIGGPLAVSLSPAGQGPLAQALRPFDLLDLEEAQLGADAREPRSNVSALLGEHGRVPAFADAALFGRLTGFVDGGAVAGNGLVRGDGFALVRDGATLAGTFEPRVAILPAGVAVAGGDPLGAPWGWIILLLVAVAAVLLVRRRSPQRNLWMRLTWAAAGLLSALAFDVFVLRRTFGAGAWSQWSDGAAAGTVMAIATFDAVVATASYLLLGLPGRVLLGRVVPQRWLLACEAAWAAVWLLLPLLFPARFFALGYTFARL